MYTMTNYEKQLLSGYYGGEARQLMDILIKVAELNNVDDLVDVKHVMIGNTCMLSVAGETGISFIKKLAQSGLRFKVPTYTNVVSIDLDQWKGMGVNSSYAQTQIEGVEAWKELGAILNCSCMPFFSGLIPAYGDHVAYADTATVIFANSYFGARSNRESDLVCLAAAITGRVPKYGFHNEEIRKGQYLIEVRAPLIYESDFGALGYYVGKLVKEKVPVFKSFNNHNLQMQNVIQLGASLASTGTVSLFHWDDFTPEIKINRNYYYDKNYITQSFSFTTDCLKNVYRQLSDLQHPEVDLVFIGCPHSNIEKIQYIAEKLQGKYINSLVELWISTPSSIKHLASKSGYLHHIERAGGKIISDTCAIILPIKSFSFRNVATDSAKAQVYLSGFGLDTAYGTTDKCLEAAISGRWEL